MVGAPSGALLSGRESGRAWISDANILFFYLHIFQQFAADLVVCELVRPTCRHGILEPEGEPLQCRVPRCSAWGPSASEARKAARGAAVQ